MRSHLLLEHIVRESMETVKFLVPGTSSEEEHEKSKLYLFSLQILTVSFRKQRRIVFRTINDSTLQKAKGYVPGTSKEEQREVVPGTSKERKGKLFLEQVKRSRGELILEQLIFAFLSPSPFT